MRIHILGICGTFMSGIALLAKEYGYEVTGSDMNVYPPMSTQLEEQGIVAMEGYDPSHIDPNVDCVVVGNVIKRGNPAMEYVLEKNIPYVSGPEWLAKQILKDRWVLAVAGTHGKTTTTSMLTWILEHAGLEPGFLIGGVPENFGISSRLGKAPYFVIEADEYDSAFFDKRSKFIHYHPRTAILNNLEFDHADIFPDLKAIQQQFQYLIRTIPGNGLIVRQADDKNISAVLEMGCWTPQHTFAGNTGRWRAQLIKPDGSEFEVFLEDRSLGIVKWDLLGNHNVENALAALAAAEHVGLSTAQSLAALPLFKNVKRRLEVRGCINNITIYDDFAHHPTAITTTLAALRAKINQARLIVVLEFGSYTMRSGVHNDRLKDSLRLADKVICKRPTQDWGLEQTLKQFSQPTALYDNVDQIVSALTQELVPGDHVIIMSNSGFDGIHNKLLQALNAQKKDIYDKRTQNCCDGTA